MNRIVIALINSVLVILIVPIIGTILRLINKTIASIISQVVGRRATIWFMNYITFIGVIHHELSHALIAFITGAKIVSIQLFHPDGKRLGNVTYIPRGPKVWQSIQAALSAIAPVILGLSSIYLLYSRVLAICTKPYQYFIIYYLLISILIHSTLSKQDIKTALPSIPICGLILIIVFYISQFNILSLI